MTSLMADMAEFQNTKLYRYIRWQNLIAGLIGKPLQFTTKSNVDSFVPVSLEYFMRVVLKMFAPGEDGKPKKGTFNAFGFRKSSYAEFADLLNVSVRTVARHVRAMKESGFLETFQVTAEDGKRCESWWIRPNLRRLMDEVLRIKAEKTGKQARKTAVSDVPPNDTDGVAFQSDSQLSLPAVAVSGADSQTEKEMTAQAPGDSSFEKTETPDSEAEKKQFGEQQFGSSELTKPELTETDSPEVDPQAFDKAVRSSILSTETGEVIRILTGLIPGIEDLPTQKLKKLHDHVYDFVPWRRLDTRMATTLAEIIPNQPELLGRFETICRDFDDVEADQHPVNILLKFWPAISKQVMGARMLHYDVDRTNDRFAYFTWQQLLFEADPTMPVTSLSDDPESCKVILFARSLRLNMPKHMVEMGARIVRHLLKRNPFVYELLFKRYPQVGRLCRFNEKEHKHLMRRAEEKRQQWQCWVNIQDRYGIEYVDYTPLVFEQG